MCKISKISKLFFFVLLIFIIFINQSNSEILKNFEISGNDRISKNTIIQFSGIKIDDEINSEDLNNAIKNLYETDFFDNVNINFKNGILKIQVVENPIIQSLKINGIKKNH